MLKEHFDLPAASAERSWVQHQARNQTGHDRDGEQRVLRSAGDKLPVAFPWQRASVLGSKPIGSWPGWLVGYRQIHWRGQRSPCGEAPGRCPKVGGCGGISAIGACRREPMLPE